MKPGLESSPAGGAPRAPRAPHVTKGRQNVSSPSTAIAPQADSAWRALRHQVTQLLDAGGTTPCIREPAPFTSDSTIERTEAAIACRVCPVLLECAAFAWANDERRFVWAGVDMSPRRGGAAGQVHLHPRTALARLLELDDETHVPAPAGATLPSDPAEKIQPRRSAGGQALRSSPSATEPNASHGNEVAS